MIVLTDFSYRSTAGGSLMKSRRLSAGLAAIVLTTLAGASLTTPAFADETDLVIDPVPEIIGDGGDPYEFTMAVSGLSDGGVLNVALLGTVDPENWLFEYEASPDVWQPIDLTSAAGTDIAVTNGSVIGFRIAASDLGHGAAEESDNDLCPIVFGPVGTELVAALFEGDDLLDEEVHPIEVVHLAGGLDGLDTGEFGEGSGEPIGLDLVKGAAPTPFSMTVCNFSQSIYTDLFLVPHISAGTDETFNPEDVSLETQDPATGEWELVELTADATGNNLDGSALFFDLGPFEDGIIDFRIAFAASTSATIALVQLRLVTQDEVVQFDRQSVVGIVAEGSSEPTATPSPTMTPSSTAPASNEKGSTLPKTGGGNGTGVLVTVAAVLVALGSGLLVAASRRRSSSRT